MWPQIIDLSLEECMKKLREMELDTYMRILSVIRAKGTLCDERRRLLGELAMLLNISKDRHKAEARRVSNNEILATIAYRLTGRDYCEEWDKEGSRGTPLPFRFPPQTVNTPLADKVARFASLGYSSLEHHKEIKNEVEAILKETFLESKLHKKSSSISGNCSEDERNSSTENSHTKQKEECKDIPHSNEKLNLVKTKGDSQDTSEITISSKRKIQEEIFKEIEDGGLVTLPSGKDIYVKPSVLCNSSSGSDSDELSNPKASTSQVVHGNGLTQDPTVSVGSPRENFVMKLSENMRDRKPGWLPKTSTIRSHLNQNSLAPEKSKTSADVGFSEDQDSPDELSRDRKFGPLSTDLHAFNSSNCPVIATINIEVESDGWEGEMKEKTKCIAESKSNGSTSFVEHIPFSVHKKWNGTSALYQKRSFMGPSKPSKMIVDAAPNFGIAVSDVHVKSGLSKSKLGRIKVFKLVQGIEEDARSKVCAKVNIKDAAGEMSNELSGCGIHNDIGATSLKRKGSSSTPNPTILKVFRKHLDSKQFHETRKIHKPHKVYLLNDDGSEDECTSESNIHLLKGNHVTKKLNSTEQAEMITDCSVYIRDRLPHPTANSYVPETIIND